jgi:uncharacterized protein (DUF924 family)
MSVAAVDQIVSFWFEELTPKNWYRRDEALDAKIRERFGETYEALKAAVPDDWLRGPEGYLAAILVLDQFPRNMFRGSPEAFATDESALALAKKAIAKDYDQWLPKPKRAFVYLPFQHSEDTEDQARSVQLFTALGNPVNLDFALRHQVIVDRFGRFPHRNAVLGRQSTQGEEAFLKEPGSSF